MFRAFHLFGFAAKMRTAESSGLTLGSGDRFISVISGHSPP